MPKKQRRSSDPAPAASLVRAAVFTSQFQEDLRWWIETNQKTALRILDLVEAVLWDPFQGIGKPEPLKFWTAGAWSRRVSNADRLVYLVEAEQISFLQCRYHY